MAVPCGKILRRAGARYLRQRGPVFRDAAKDGVNKSRGTRAPGLAAELHSLVHRRGGRHAVHEQQLRRRNAQDIQHRGFKSFCGRFAPQIEVMVNKIQVLQRFPHYTRTKCGLARLQSGLTYHGVHGVRGVGSGAALPAHGLKRGLTPVCGPHTTFTGWPNSQAAASMRRLPGACSSVTRTVRPPPQAISSPAFPAETTLPGALSVTVSVYSAL